MLKRTTTITLYWKILFWALISSHLLLLQCSAYLNTFYNAENAFNEAQVSHLKIMRAFPDSLVVTPPSDAVTKYDRAIEKATKSMELFQKNKKWHDDALFLMGKAYFFKQENEKAIRRFRQLEQQFPESPLLPQTYLFIAKAYIEDGNLDKAEEVLLKAEKHYPELNKDQPITLLMITIAIRRNGKSQAITLLEETLKSIRSDNIKLDLFLQTAELYIELKQYEKAILILKKAPRKKDLPVHSYRLDRALVVCYKSIDSLQLANQLVVSMLANKNYSTFMDEMLYQQGTIACARGDYDGAIKIFKKLTTGIDSSSVVSDTSSFKCKALYELALIYQKQKKDYTKTYNYLKLAANSRDTVSSRPAKQKLSAMERLQKLRDKNEKPDSIHGRSEFTIGELFRFELDEPDSAYNQFLALGRDTGTDTMFIPRALIQAAIIARDVLKQPQKSDSLFEVIIKRFPATEYAKIAQRESGKAVTITTRYDSAAALYGAAEKLFYSENDVKGAIQQFFNVYKTFPEQAVAPKSLFAAAYFTNTVLYKNKTAKMLYEMICEKYPQSLYCTEQAKPRIKMVVDTLAKLDELRRMNAKTPPKKVPVTATGKQSTSISPTEVPAASENLLEQELSGDLKQAKTASDTGMLSKDIQPAE